MPNATRSVAVYLRAQVADFKRQMDEASASTENVGKKAKESSSTATTALGRMTKSALDNREAWDRAGTAITAFGAATSAALALSVRAAIQWESAWAGVAKTVDGSDAQMAALEGDLRQLARTLPASHQEIAAVAEAAGQLGVSVDGIASFTKTMIDLGETTNLSADAAATAIAQMANVMGLDLSGGSDDVQRFGATLVALGNNGASTESDIVTMAQRIAGSGKLVGATSGEVLALSNALASMGVTAELGGGVASRVLQDIYTAVQNGGDDLESFARVAGMSAADFATAFGEDPIRALGSFAQGLNDVEASGGNVVGTLTDLGFRSTEEQRILLQLKASGDLLNDSLDMQAQAWASNTALIDEATKRYDTTEAKLQIAKNSINDAAITLGETFLPAVAGAADAVASLAQWFGALPAPLQQSAGSLTAVAGVAAVAAGSFLMLFPRVVETAGAFKQLRADGSRVPGVLTGIGKAAAALAVILPVLASFEGVPEGSTASVSKMTQALLDLENSSSSLDALFGKGLEDNPFAADIDSFADAVDRIVNPTTGNRINDFIGELVTLGQATGDVDLESSIDQIDTMGESLAAMVAAGNAEKAAQTFDLLADVWVGRGGDLQDLRDMMPAYTDALAEVDNQQQLAGDSASGMAGDLDALAGSTAAVDEELQKWLEDVASVDAAFVDALGAYDTLVQKNKDAAQATADATESSKDSWQDFYDGFSVSTAEYLAELQRQVDAQTNWETNLLLLSGRVSQGVVDELYSMGSEGAPLVAQLVNATDDELARMEELFGQRSETATMNFATALSDSAPLISAVAATLGNDAAVEIATKLANGTATVESIMAEYGITIEGLNPTVNVDANTDDATRELNTFVATWNNKVISVSTAAVAYSASGGMPGGGTATRRPDGHADGGPIYGPGTGTSDSILARLSNGEHVWTAAEVAATPGGHAGVERLRAGALAGSLPAFASGGAVSTEIRRNQLVPQATASLSGAYGLTDTLRDVGESMGPAGRDLLILANQSEAAMRRLWSRADAFEAKVAAARDRMSELASIADSVSSSLSRDGALSSLMDSARTASVRSDAAGNVWYEDVTSKSLVKAAKAKAQSIRTFAGKLQKLQKAGLTGALLQEVASLGVEEGSAVADALLAGGKNDIAALNAATKDITRWSDKAGQYVTQGYYKGGVSAAEGLVKGLESQQAAIEKQMVKVAKGMQSALKKALGIASPSRVMRALGHDTGAGFALGLGDTESDVAASAASLAAAALPGTEPWATGYAVPAPASSAAPVAVNVDASGFAAALDGSELTLVVDGQPVRAVVRAVMADTGRAARYATTGRS